MKTVKLNAFDNPFVYGVNNKEYLVFNIDNETQTLKFQSLIGDLKVKTANILFKANSLPAKLYEMVVDDDILTFTLSSVLTGYNGSMYVYLLLNYSDDLSTSDLYTFKLVDKGSSTFNFEISSICESNISTIVSEEIKNERVAKSILDTVSNYEFDKLQHAQQSLSLVENAFSSTLEKRIDLFNSAYDKANATKSNTTGDINDSDIDIPSSNTDSDLKDYVENVKTQMSERLKDVTVVSQQIQDEMAQEKQSFLGSSLIFQQDLKQERDIISAYGESTRQHMDQEFNEVKDYADKVFSEFSEGIPDLDASIKQVNDKIVATDNKVGTLNTKVTNVENDITELEKMHNEVTQTINNGKLISLYSNSLDFGDYDYSGNPNLMFKLKSSDFNAGYHGSINSVNEMLHFTSDGTGSISMFTRINTPALASGKTYTLSAKVRFDEGTTGAIDKLRLVYRTSPGEKILLEANSTNITTDDVGKEITIKGTANVNYQITNLDRFYMTVSFANFDKINGGFKLYDIKIEEGSTATPYQPNLLDAPYYFSKVPLGENLCDPTVKFPISSSVETLYSGRAPEDFVEGETYTVTIGATKPSTQSLGVYLALKNLAIFKPVEGLTNTWTATLKIDILGEKKNAVYIYQSPRASVGACQIDWIKIEKGDTRTPNIESYKYKGVSLRNTIDPTAFDWQEHIVADVSTLKEQVNTLTPKVDNSQLFKLTKDDGNTIKVDYMSPKPASFLALAKNIGFYSISTAESKLMSDYNELPALLQNTFLFINNYPPRDGFIIQEITGGEISTQLVHKYYRRIEPDGTYKNWNKVITDKDVSKMKTLYSNFIDFGDYDYSGNPNLLVPIDFSKLSASSSLLATPPKYVKDYGQYFELDGSDPDNLDKAKNVFIPLLTRLTKGKTYTIRVGMMIDDNFILGNSAFYYTVWTGKPTATSDRLVNVTPDEGSRNAWKVYTKTFTVPSDQKDGDTAPFLQLYFLPQQKGKIKIGYDIKLEEGTTATPYQPNLLDEPYYLSKIPLGENIANKSVVFPIKSSAYSLYQADMEEEFVLGQTYTITIKATKPSIQTFIIYNEGSGDYKYGNLVPVEGLSDTWGLTFTPQKVGANYPKRLTIIQYPESTAGACQIDWLKIEKGDTRTPNISQYKYFGEGLKDSNNPNDYSWDITPEYTEKRVNNSVSLTEPQSIDGTKNFLETPLVNGKNVLFDEKPLPYEGWYTWGEELKSLPNKSKLRVGPVVATIGKQHNRSMNTDPLQWNGSRYEATVLRDCTVLIEGFAKMQYGSGSSGQFGYLVFYRDSAQTNSIGYVGGTGGSVPHTGGPSDKLQWKQGTQFSRIMELHKGQVFNITFETSDGANVDFAQIQTLHVMEIDPL